VFGSIQSWLRNRHREKLARRLVYSAKDRCACGAGFAYDGRSLRSSDWDCSAIILGDAMFSAGERGAVDHSNPCQYFEVVSERQPAAMGSSTRPSAA
jgi:hypothetical protein